MARAAAQRLENVDELIDSVETFIFDCDGVIWKGDKLIDGVPGTLDMLRSKGKRLVFVTNNSTKSRKQYGKKFETLGLSVSEEEIFASSFAAAAYLKSIDFPKDKKVSITAIAILVNFFKEHTWVPYCSYLPKFQVYVIGEDGILKELELAGYQYLGGPCNTKCIPSQEDGDKKIELKPGFLMEHDHNVKLEQLWLDLIATSTTTKFSRFLVCFSTCSYLIANSCVAGGGSMVGAISGSTQREPLVVGKPSTFMMDYLANR
ncbi:hypothetical protein B296_00028204 [Ensete ventricosum]|uniref:Phosphoglycolate phosphatase n=1 Tax=Ensete ventricosum TaxID=4639 RepID=A0A427A1L4_ENSVE|nr:hypothetical protein B296_00028204 [Ensete ventricosum]